MEKYDIANFTNGWFIGDFEPSLEKTKDFEVCYKKYKTGQVEAEHYHLIATEYTLIIDGIVSFNDKIFNSGDIVKVSPKEKIIFKSITDAKTVVIKVPSSKGDKYIC